MMTTCGSQSWFSMKAREKVFKFQQQHILDKMADETTVESKQPDDECEKSELGNTQEDQGKTIVDKKVESVKTNLGPSKEGKGSTSDISPSQKEGNDQLGSVGPLKEGNVANTSSSIGVDNNNIDNGARKPTPPGLDDVSVAGQLSPALRSLMKEKYLDHLEELFVQERLLTKMHVATLRRDDIMPLNLKLGDRNILSATASDLWTAETQGKSVGLGLGLQGASYRSESPASNYSCSALSESVESQSSENGVIQTAVYAKPTTKKVQESQANQSIAEYYFGVDNDCMIQFPSRGHYVCLVCDGNSKAPLWRRVRAHSEIRKHGHQKKHQENLARMRKGIRNTPFFSPTARKSAKRTLPSVVDATSDEDIIRKRPKPPEAISASDAKAELDAKAESEAKAVLAAKAELEAKKKAERKKQLLAELADLK